MNILNASVVLDFMIENNMASIENNNIIVNHNGETTILNSEKGDSITITAKRKSSKYSNLRTDLVLILSDVSNKEYVQHKAGEVLRKSQIICNDLHDCKNV